MVNRLAKILLINQLKMKISLDTDIISHLLLLKNQVKEFLEIRSIVLYATQTSDWFVAARNELFPEFACVLQSDQRLQNLWNISSGGYKNSSQRRIQQWRRH